MSLWRLALQLVGVCQHPHYRREREASGRLLLVCDDCGHSAPAMVTTASDRKRTKALVQRVQRVRAEMARGPVSEKVTPMRRRAK